MTFSVYTDADGYIGEVSAPDRATAAAFLAAQGYAAGSYDLREVIE